MQTSSSRTIRPSQPGRQAINLIVVLSLVLIAFNATGPIPVLVSKAQPLLLQIASEQPEQMVRVIVQRLSHDTSLEAKVASLGGQVTRDLSIINAFAAEMTAEAAMKLSQTGSVRWISLDAPTQQSSSSQGFTTWAAKVGTVVTNGFTTPENMLSPAGPNGTYGFGKRVKGSFGDFQPTYSPGQKISRVGVALKLYLSTTLASSETIKVTAYVNNKAGTVITVSPSVVNGCVSAASICRLVIDITSSRIWKWSDFSTLEILIDQSALASTKTVYYDAVGLHIQTTDGSDGTTPLSLTASSDTAATDASILANVFPRVIRATDAWNTAPYYQGSGITVAVVDSGNFKSNGLGTRLVGVVNFNSTEQTASDRYGHGSHVTGIIADDGSLSGGQYKGVAPKVNILGLRVSDDQGMSYESDVIAALQWIYNNRTTYNIRVVNLSLNSSVYQSYDNSPLDAAVEILWFNSTVVVASAGNNGSATLYPPANDPFIITVGATDDKGTLDKGDDVLASFSAYGLDDLGYPKPDVVAPGKNIIAYLPDVGALTISQQHPENQVSSYYFRMSGTSMSAPMVSGAVALLLQKAQETGQNLTPDQVKYRLMATADKNWAGYDAKTAGAGYLDIFAAINSTTIETANVGLMHSKLLTTGSNPITWGSVGWNSVGWNSVGWNSVGWNSVGWNSVGWNSDYWGQ